MNKANEIHETREPFQIMVGFKVYITNKRIKHKLTPVPFRGYSAFKSLQTQASQLLHYSECSTDYKLLCSLLRRLVNIELRMEKMDGLTNAAQIRCSCLQNSYCMNTSHLTSFKYHNFTPFSCKLNC